MGPTLRWLHSINKALRYIDKSKIKYSNFLSIGSVRGVEEVSCDCVPAFSKLDDIMWSLLVNLNAWILLDPGLDNLF